MSAVTVFVLNDSEVQTLAQLHNVKRLPHVSSLPAFTSELTGALFWVSADTGEVRQDILTNMVLCCLHVHQWWRCSATQEGRLLACARDCVVCHQQEQPGA